MWFLIFFLFWLFLVFFIGLTFYNQFGSVLNTSIGNSFKENYIRTKIDL